MKFKKILLATTALCVVATPAHAAFTVGSFVLSALTAIPGGAALTFGVFGAASAATIGSTVLSFALTAGSFAAQFLTRPNLPRPEAIKNTTAGETGPGRHAFGRVVSEAKIAYGRTDGYTLHRVGLMHFEKTVRVQEYFVNDIPVVVEADGTVSSPPWVKLGSSYLKLETKAGDGTETAWPALVSAYPTEWTSAHKIQGIAQYLATVTNPGTSSPIWGKLLQKGFPRFGFLEDVGEWYDPRDASTEWSLNGALIALHYFRQVSGYSDSQIDFTLTGAAATWCDATVSTYGASTAPRSQLSGGWEGVVDVDKVEIMLECAGLQVRHKSDGSVYFEGIDDNPAAEITFPWQHVLDWSWQNGPEGAERPNICRVKYFSPESRYTVEEIPGIENLPWGQVAGERSRFGDQEMVISLPFCCNSSQAQRIARRLFHMARARVVVIKTSLAGIALRNVYALDLQLDGLGENGGVETIRCIVEDHVINNAEGTCEVTLRVIPTILQTAWNYATDEAAPPPTVPVSEYVADIAAPSAPTAATTVQYPVAGTYETRCMFGTVTGATQAEVLYNTYTVGGDPEAPLSLDNAVLSGTTWLAYETLDVLGDKIRFRARVFNASDEGSALSGPLIVDPVATNNTAPSAPTVSATYNAGDWDVDWTAPAEISVVAIVFETRLSTGSWSVVQTVDARPFQQGSTSVASATGAPTYTTQIRMKCITTNGTSGAYTSISQQTVTS